MLKFSEFINEGYKNFIGSASERDRNIYIDRVWDILQKSYAPIGGIKGSGFGSKEELVSKIPMWKLFLRGDFVKAAVFYKDKGGRKAVAIATDGSDEGKKIIKDIYKEALKNSYGEKSGPALGLQMKDISDSDIKKYFFKPKEVEALIGDKCIPVVDFGVENLDPADKRTWDKFPKLHQYFYVRELGGEMHMKVTSGVAGLPIIRY